MECLLPYLYMVTVPHIMVGLERMLDYRGVELARFHCTSHPYTANGNVTTKQPNISLTSVQWATVQRGWRIEDISYSCGYV